MTTWLKDPAIYPAGAVGGDNQVSDGWNTRYTLAENPVNGCYAIVDENWYPVIWGDDEHGYSIDVMCQTEYHLVTDPDDPGGSEVWSDYEYDGEWTLRGFVSVPECEAECKKFAEHDYSSAYVWDGTIPERGRFGA